MARKNYQVKAKNGACWQKIHDELCSSTVNLKNIPDRSCNCKNDIAYDETRGTYQFSIAEVEELRKHPDILWVQLDPEWHPELEPDYDITAAVRFGKNVKNYRSLYKNTTTPDPATKTEIANSLTMADLQGSDTNNWVLVKTIHPNTSALQYWASKEYPLIVDYGMYPSAPATPSEPDPLVDILQTAYNDITITQAGYYELEIAADGSEAYVSTSGPGSASHAEIPVRPGRHEPGHGIGDRAGIRYDVIQLGKLTTGTLRINTKIKNGSHPDPAKETWDQNPGCIAWKLYYLGNPTMSSFWCASSSCDTAAPIPFTTNADNTDILPWPSVTSSDQNRTGYQLKRCEEGGTNAWGSDTNQVLSTDISYTNDGTDVDLIVCDNGVWGGHPEFVTDSADPQHYISGNVLSRHGRCGVLDIILDGPYYMDPDYFNADPANRLVTRWDGTIVPNETTARNWWYSHLLRSPNLPQNIGSLTVPATYTRARVMGDEYSIPTNPSAGNHGTPCASLAYGKNYGWGFNANKWQMEINLGHGSGMSMAYYTVALKIFHENKPTNPKHGTQDPTVVSGSYYYRHQNGKAPKYVGNETTSQSYNDGVGTDLTIGYTYQGTSGTKTRDISLLSDPDVGNFIRGEAMLPGFVAGMKPIAYTSPYFYFANQNESVPNGPMSVGIENHINSISAGIHWCLAAGNEGAYVAALDDPNINNRVTSADDINYGEPITDIACGWTHRASFPASVSYGRALYEPNNYTDTQGHEQFIIGGIDDKVKSRWTPITDVFWKDSSTNPWGSEHSETIAMSLTNTGVNQYAQPDLHWKNNPSNPVIWSTERDYWENKNNQDYSNRGTLIDFWAPADGTLAATNDKSSNEPNNSSKNYPNPSPRPCSGGTYQDCAFSGTSAACPVAAGIVACNLQQNRGWTTKQLKDHMKSVTPNADFYKGPVPNGVDDRAHWAWCSNQGIDAKIIQERSDSKTTPNISYETTNGIAPSRPNLNERFSITSSGTHTVKIVSIREFSTSDAGSPTSLRLANGWYPVQIVTTNTSSTTLANYKMRIKSGSNDQVLEISSDGGSSWTAFTITTVNGNFDTDDSGRFWYYLNVGDDVSVPEIDDSSYSIQTNTSSVNEGGTLITTITTTGVSNGTTLYWSFSGTGISSSDFSSGSLTGSGSISNNSFNFTHIVALDGLTEGSETLQIKLFTDSARQLQVASKNVTIADTSSSSSYAISPSTTSVNEGSPLVYGVGTSNVADGTTLYWSLSGSGITAGDFSPSGLTGSGTINNSAFAFTRSIVSDSTTEGPETITFKLFTDSARTNEVASNSSVTIQDTSTTPAEPAYNLSVSPTSVNEGETFTSTVTTTNVAQGTNIWYSAMGANIDANDYSSGYQANFGTVGFDGTFQFSHTLAEDEVTEGTETILVKIFTNAGYTQQVGSTVNVTVNDTSATSTYNVSTDVSQVSEGGGQITLTCTTTNVTAGTTLYWNISGTNITSADIVGGVMQNQFNINSQGNASWGINFTSDATLEGDETATVKVFTDSARTIEVASTQFEILDSSIPAPTYQVLPNPTQGNEGTSFTTTISTTNVPDGTVLYWALEDSDGTNTYITSDDFTSGSLTGSGTISSSSMSFSHTLANDLTTESLESIWIRLYGDSARLSQLAYGNFEIADTSQSPTASYTISPDATTIAEGQMLNVRFITSNVAAGTDLYWTVVSVSGNVIAADVGGVGNLSQAVQTPVSGTTYDGFTYGFAIAEDATTEGPEVFKIELRTGSQGGTLVATSPNITISDTSLTPGSPVYAITTNKTSYDEGEFLYVTMTTQNVTLPTTLYWQFSGSNITANDFNEGALEGQWSIDQTATSTINTKLRNDLDTEGNETLIIKGFSDSARTNQVGNTVNVTINDTSLNPAVPAYNITPSVTQLDEGSTLTTTVTTQNVADGTTLYWVVDQHTGTINAGDFSSGGMNGTGTVNNSTFTITHVIANDALTESGEEKFAIKLYTDAGYTNNVANTSVIEIFDTSQTASASYSLSTTASTFNEGDSFTTTVITTNVVDATTLYWRLEGIDANDLSAGNVEGSGIITSNTFTFSHTLANDLADEGDENLQIKLFTDSARNNQVGNTLAVLIKDTSQVGFNVIVTAPNNNEYILIGNDTDGTI